MQIIIILIIVALTVVLKLHSAKIIGSIGEFKVNTRLNFLGNEYISLNDIFIKSSNGYTSQISISIVNLTVYYSYL